MAWKRTEVDEEKALATANPAYVHGSEQEQEQVKSSSTSSISTTTLVIVGIICAAAGVGIGFVLPKESKPGVISPPDPPGPPGPPGSTNLTESYIPVYNAMETYLQEVCRAYSDSQSRTSFLDDAERQPYEMAWGDDVYYDLNTPKPNSRRLQGLRSCESILELIDEAVETGYDTWTAEEKANATMFRYNVRMTIVREVYIAPYSTYVPVDSRSGPQGFAGYFANQQINSLGQLQQHINILSGVPDTFRRYTRNMRRGLELGYQPAVDVLVAVPGQLDTILNATVSPFISAAVPKLDTIEGAIELASKLFEAGNQTVTALREFRAYFVDEYIPALNKTAVGIVDRAPNGEELYNALIEYHTSTKLTAKEIHQLGLNEVERILERMRVIAERNNPSFDNVGEYLEWLRDQEDNKYTSGEDLLREHRAVGLEIAPKMPQYFGILPRAPFGVEPIPEVQAQAGGIAYYNGGSPGIVSVNTYLFEEMRKHTARSLMAHEGAPGHHHQVAIASFEAPRPNPLATRTTAYIEGWGLYTEYLGEEMGLYPTDRDLFGRLQLEQLRACRLVVDTGMHAFGWTKKQADDFMVDNFSASRVEVEGQTTRYLSIAGQALAYKVGEIFIKNLRTKAEQELGDAFKLSDFHDAVMMTNYVSLATLETAIDTWIQEVKTATP